MSNHWLDHIQETKQAYPEKTYKECMILAKETYKKEEKKEEKKETKKETKKAA